MKQMMEDKQEENRRGRIPADSFIHVSFNDSISSKNVTPNVTMINES
jgi:hypothetical protein